MRETFLWNPYADQPHNVAPRKERFRHHFKHADTYLSLALSNLQKAVPVLTRYKQYRKRMYKDPHRIEDPFAISVSPAGNRSSKVIELLKEADVKKTLVRLPSWENENFDVYEKFLSLLHQHNIEITIALLQQRDDVLNPSRWERFLANAFSRFGKVASFFEVGHAWNRTKWGVWNYKEYLKLLRPAATLAKTHGVRIVGPAVIDFEFHLYPPVLSEVSFDKVSSLLYVDRKGAPENKQSGWDTARKLALLKAVVDGSSSRKYPLWITEVNWPLKGTGKYSPASGKPNVSEEEQADYLVRYFVLCLSSGFVERIYWWQLVAPGYGLVDSRGKEWRRRPSFFALKTMIPFLKNSNFMGKMQHTQAEIFLFSKVEERLAICWTINKEEKASIVFPERVIRVISRDGQEISCRDNEINIDGSPRYVFYES